MTDRSRAHGPWQILSSQTVYSDPWIDVRLDQVLRPDRQPGTHTVTSIKPGVCVIALDAEQQVLLTSEFHYAVGRVTLEGVSGGCEADELPLVTAQRELQEELGLIAERWTPLSQVDPFTAMVRSPTALFLAEELHETAARPEGTEQIGRVRIPLATAIEKVFASEITHGPTCVALLEIWIRVTQHPDDTGATVRSHSPGV